MTRIFILVESGRVTDVYADSNAVEVEIIDLDGGYTYEDHVRAKQRADEVQGIYSKVD